MADKKEQGFNDAELQDIMSEIENLEREYEGDDKPEAIDESSEVNASSEQVEEEHESIVETNLVNLTPKTSSVSADHQVDFQGSGQMNFSMNFDVAGQTAHLEITEQGLVVSLDGMHLSLNEENGCTVEMEGGVKFSVPMGNQAKGSKAA